MPDLARRWDAAANAPLTPAEVTRGSGQLAFWTCESGHPSFQAPVWRMTRTLPNGQLANGCPECSFLARRAPRAGRKSLAEEFPEVAQLWDYEANHPLTPEQVAPRSNEKAWFICPEHGSTLSYISNRTAGHGCPACGRGSMGQILREHALKRGTLAETRPELAALWNVELNGKSADQVAPGSTDFGWWDCPEDGHAPYRSKISTKVRGTGCPACGKLSRISHLKSYDGPKPGQSLADLRPEVAAFWDAARNDLTPHDFSPFSHHVAHWSCAAGHSFEKPVAGMSQSTSCPVCRAVKKATGRRA